MKRKQMSNKKYGSLTVLEFVENGENGARWKCQCDCGEIKIVDGYLLRRGSVKTCGCRIDINENLTGNRYGWLVVIKEAGRHKDRSILWECECSCGEIIIVKARSLKSGETKSCSCLRRIKKGEANFNKLFKNYKNSAKARNILFDLTKEEFRILTKEKCYYCGSEPEQKSYRKYSNGAYFFNGIDRKNNLLGYTKENSLPCCFICNRAKSNLSYEEFLLWIDKIKKK